jgi:hypothetical protein
MGLLAGGRGRTITTGSGSGTTARAGWMQQLVDRRWGRQGGDAGGAGDALQMLLRRCRSMISMRA